jgi:16S rRNA (guanine966-N2)-methyltransferase
VLGEPVLAANLRDMTRVIAGAAGGRRLSVPAGRDTRPTSDRAREGLFATVHAIHGPLAGASVLDLYAGSGAVGLEALSRGAAHACLVEADPRAVRVIRANISALSLPGARVIAGRVEPVLARGPDAQRLAGGPDAQERAGRPDAQRLAGGPAAQPADGGVAGQEAGPSQGSPGGGSFDVVFADPPYAMTGDAVTAVLTTLVEAGWLVRDALVVVERSTRSGAVRWPAGYLEDRSRRYGEATLWYGLATGALQA